MKDRFFAKLAIGLAIVLMVFSFRVAAAFYRSPRISSKAKLLDDDRNPARAVWRVRDLSGGSCIPEGQARSGFRTLGALTYFKESIQSHAISAKWTT